jgi:hypothetical protein
MNGFNRNVRTKEFKEMFARLPEEIQGLANGAFEMFQENPAHNALRHHALGDNNRGKHRERSFSVSITMQYRAVYTRDGDTNVWYWIGTHSDYDTFIGKK